MQVNSYDVELERLEERATARLLTAEVYDALAFEALYGHLAAKAKELRDASTVSKQILGSLRRAAAAIRSRSEYVASARDGLLIADQFEMLLDLIVIGEIPDDRRPGEPRII